MLFEFRLRRVHDVAPWHDSGGTNPHLRWYGLTDGWYWVRAGEAELYRYSQASLRQMEREHGSKPWWIATAGLPYVDYQVAQLWGDVLWMLPDVLEPVPPWLARTLGPQGEWSEWLNQAESAIEDLVTKGMTTREAQSLLYDATRWLGKRRLDSAYLVAGPYIQIWSDERDMHIWWDNRRLLLEGVAAWEAELGQYTLSRQAFLDEVHAFNDRFLRRMHDRIAIAQAEWDRPEIALDPHLAESQRTNEQWSRSRFESTSPREPTDWDVVHRSIASIEALPEITARTAIRLL